MSRYTAIQTFHHPDGVLLAGETAELSDDVAIRGIEAGTIDHVQESPETPNPPVAEAAETQE